MDINAHDKSQEEKSANILLCSWMFQNVVYALFDDRSLTELDIGGHNDLQLAT